ncbi:MAG: Lrp/AsnC family transcriptional regulator [Clostridia bacterium]|nr:Lrp/AsnC family transcriptional regulator [Clostridia bacterium]MBQ6000825.1 Lrp/AsnC family transcriptional regulator [Clostridia bacterium]MBQ6059211.1 Lrp/AsnC family transcriptional regulator [Clostridia bacterium]
MAEKVKKIDAVDTKIIKLLQINARTTASDIAEKIGMSVPAVSERLRKLENAGIIDRYTAILNNAKMGKEVMAIMLVAMNNPDLAVATAFRELVTAEPDVLECYSVTGEYDYHLKIITSSTSTLEQLLARIKAAVGVSKTSTAIILSTLKLNFPIEI